MKKSINSLLAGAVLFSAVAIAEVAPVKETDKKSFYFHWHGCFKFHGKKVWPSS